MPGTFTLSIDFELAWGEFYRRPVDVARMLAARQAVPELLRLLERHQIPATFAIVGHLLLEGCDGHRSMPRPDLSWRSEDWYTGDPQSDEKSDPAWYAASLVRTIAAAEPGHDIGGHGFSHIPLDDAGVSSEVAAAEMAEVARLLPKEGGSSFVFPRNGIMHRELLEKKGFRCYRAVEPRWYAEQPVALKKMAHMLDQALAVTPRVGHARRVGGLVEVPSSMLFLSREGFRRYIPMRSRVVRALRGVARSVADGASFHLWMHVEDLVPDTAAMLAGLEAVLSEVRGRVGSGELEVRTMADFAAGEPN